MYDLFTGAVKNYDDVSLGVSSNVQSVVLLVNPITTSSSTEEVISNILFHLGGLSEIESSDNMGDKVDVDSNGDLL